MSYNAYSGYSPYYYQQAQPYHNGEDRGDGRGASNSYRPPVAAAPQPSATSQVEATSSYGYGSYQATAQERTYNQYSCGSLIAQTKNTPIAASNEQLTYHPYSSRYATSQTDTSASGNPAYVSGLDKGVVKPNSTFGSSAASAPPTYSTSTYLNPLYAHTLPESRGSSNAKDRRGNPQSSHKAPSAAGKSDQVLHRPNSQQDLGPTFQNAPAGRPSDQLRHTSEPKPQQMQPNSAPNTRGQHGASTSQSYTNPSHGRSGPVEATMTTQAQRSQNSSGSQAPIAQTQRPQATQQRSSWAGVAHSTSTSTEEHPATIDPRRIFNQDRHQKGKAPEGGATQKAAQTHSDKLHHATAATSPAAPPTTPHQAQTGSSPSNEEAKLVRMKALMKEMQELDQEMFSKVFDRSKQPRSAEGHSEPVQTGKSTHSQALIGPGSPSLATASAPIPASALVSPSAVPQRVTHTAVTSRLPTIERGRYDGTIDGLPDLGRFPLMRRKERVNRGFRRGGTPKSSRSSKTQPADAVGSTTNSDRQAGLSAHAPPAQPLPPGSPQSSQGPQDGRENTNQLVKDHHGIGQSAPVTSLQAALSGVRPPLLESAPTGTRATGTPHAKSTWPEGRKTQLAVLAKDLLESLPANAGKKLDIAEFVLILDTDPTFEQLVQNLLRRGFKFQHSVLASALLEGMPERKSGSRTGTPSRPTMPSARSAVVSAVTIASRTPDSSVPASRQEFEAHAGVDNLTATLRPVSSGVAPPGVHPPPSRERVQKPSVAAFPQAPPGYVPIYSESGPRSHSVPPNSVPPPPRLVLPQAPAEPQSKEQAARKRNFSDLVDLTVLSDEEVELPRTEYTEQYTKRQMIYSDHSPVGDRPRHGNLFPSYSGKPQQAKDGAAAQMLLSPSEHPRPSGLFSTFRNSTATDQRRDALQKLDICGPLDPKKGLGRRTRYDVTTLARDILISKGLHPSEQKLNWHLDHLLSEYKGISTQCDLATLRWDLLDPGGARPRDNTGPMRPETSNSPHQVQRLAVIASQRGDQSLTPSSPPPRAFHSGGARTRGRPRGRPRGRRAGMRDSPSRPHVTSENAEKGLAPRDGASTRVTRGSSHLLPFNPHSARAAQVAAEIAPATPKDMLESSTTTLASSHTQPRSQSISVVVPVRHSSDSASNSPQASRERSIKNALSPQTRDPLPSSVIVEHLSQQQVDSREPSPPLAAPSAGRRRGRPPGSWNKSHLKVSKTTSNRSNPAASDAPRRRGRPPGSKSLWPSSIRQHNSDVVPRRTRVGHDGIGVMVPSVKPQPVSYMEPKPLPEKRYKHNEYPEEYPDLDEVTIFRCQWAECDAELHNLKTLQRHVEKVHSHVRGQASHPLCLWADCAGRERALGRSDDATSGQSFSSIGLWQAHMDSHLLDVAKELGDGPSTSPTVVSPRVYTHDEFGNPMTPLAMVTGPPDPLPLGVSRKNIKNYHAAHGNVTDEQKSEAMLLSAEIGHRIGRDDYDYKVTFHD